MRDFNIRMDSENRFNTNDPVIEDSLELFLQELDTIFSTSKCDILGDCEVGNNIEDLLWKTSFNTNRIESEISDSIRSFCFMNEFFRWTVSVNLIKGNTRDIAEIDVNIEATTTTEFTSIRWIFR